MAENSKIEWCDATFNPWWGCQKVSPACDHCYAERDAKRFAPGRVLWGVDSERRTFEDKHWKAPRDWAKVDFYECEVCGHRGPAVPVGLNRHGRACKKCDSESLRPARMRVFCASMADWLDLDAPISEFVRLLDTIRLTPELDWLLLTKRIGNWRKRLREAREHIADGGGMPLDLLQWIEAWIDGNPTPNVWLGATVVNQEEADRDIPKLLAVPARVRFLSIEPMLGPIDLTNVRVGGGHGHHEFDPIITGNALHRATSADPSVHWVICGGESGHRARPMHPDWARSLRDQCAAAGVPFLFKQWGEWAPSFYMPDSGMWFVHDSHRWPITDGEPAGGVWSYRIGKKAAGRLLDGVEHNGFPEPQHA